MVICMNEKQDQTTPLDELVTELRDLRNVGEGGGSSRKLPRGSACQISSVAGTITEN